MTLHLNKGAAQLLGAHVIDSVDGDIAVVAFSDDLDAELCEAADQVEEGGKLVVIQREGENPDGVAAYRGIDIATLLRRHGEIDEAGVTEQGHLVAVATRKPRRGKVCVWTGFAIGPWHPMDIVERGLGGSETAAWRLAEEFAQMGYEVDLFGQFEQEGMFGDVLLRDFRRFDHTEAYHAVVGFRHAPLFDHRPNARTTIMWLEDLAGAEGLTPARGKNIDHICCVSRWHVGNLLEHYPWLDLAGVPGAGVPHVHACRNGITHAFFEDAGEPERELRVLYTSSPDRGLSMLLERIWPRVVERVPDAKLVSTYSRWYDIVADIYPQTMAERQRINQATEDLGSFSRITGGMGQRDLAKLMRSSMVWVHPAWFRIGDAEFHETSCISAMEAQAAGCVVVASDWGALSETVQVGTLIDGDPRVEGGNWECRFADAVVQALTNESVQAAAQTAGPEAVRNMHWRGAAEEVASMFAGEYFEHGDVDTLEEAVR